MKTELENADWIITGIRESLEKIREAQKEDSEWDKVAETEEAWE
jgi:hypothetical protein